MILLPKYEALVDAWASVSAFLVVSFFKNSASHVARAVLCIRLKILYRQSYPSV